MDCEIFIRTVGPEDDVLEWLQTALSSYLSVLVTLYLIPALKGRGCGVGYQKEVSNRAEKRGTLPIKKAICANYSCPSFALIYHSSPLFLLLCFFLLFSSRGGLNPQSLFPQSTFLLLIPPWQSAFFGCSLPRTHSIHLILLYISLCPSVGVSIFRVLKFQCTHTSSLLPISSTPVFAAFSHKLYSSIFPITSFSSPCL